MRNIAYILMLCVMLKKTSSSFTMIDKVINTIRADKENWTKFHESFVEKEISSKTVLLKEGEISNNIFLIKKGCLREWFNKDGGEGEYPLTIFIGKKK